MDDIEITFEPLLRIAIVTYKGRSINVAAGENFSERVEQAKKDIVNVPL